MLSTKTEALKTSTVPGFTSLGFLETIDSVCPCGAQQYGNKKRF